MRKCVFLAEVVEQKSLICQQTNTWRHRVHTFYYMCIPTCAPADIKGCVTHCRTSPPPLSSLFSIVLLISGVFQHTDFSIKALLICSFALSFSACRSLFLPSGALRSLVVRRAYRDSAWPLPPPPLVIGVLKIARFHFSLRRWCCFHISPAQICNFRLSVCRHVLSQWVVFGLLVVFFITVQINSTNFKRISGILFFPLPHQCIWRHLDDDGFFCFLSKILITAVKVNEPKHYWMSHPVCLSLIVNVPPNIWCDTSSLTTTTWYVVRKLCVK